MPSACIIFPHGPNARSAGEAHGSGVIYDIRHVTTYAIREARLSFLRAAAAAGAADRATDSNWSPTAFEIRPRPAERNGTAGFLRHPHRERS